MKLLFVSSEIFPHAKSGGLADVAHALPRALKKYLDISRVMPLYGFMNKELLEKCEISFRIELSGIYYNISLYTSENDGVKTYFIDAPLLSFTQNLYGDAKGEYSNNDLRFGIFCAAAVELAVQLHVDILHLNDWHSALCALFIKDKKLNLKTVFTIHNLAYQGVFGFDSLQRLGIDKKYFTMDALEFHSKVNLMKAGIAYSDCVTTVSPRYAEEILSNTFGCGLDGFLQKYSSKLFGVLNGIDTATFSPLTDKALIAPFDSEHLELKYLNKKELFQNIGVQEGIKNPLFAMISRLAHQKGFDLLLSSLELILSRQLHLLLLVEGTASYKEQLEEFAKKYDNFSFLFGYDEELSHRIYASADFLLMPSLFEPCGLNQMIAMRYATVPVVHGVGGLFDTVHEDESVCGRGIVFFEPTKKALLGAIERALELYQNTQKMQEIIHFNMKCDFSFDKSAKVYFHYYQNLFEELQ